MPVSTRSLLLGKKFTVEFDSKGVELFYRRHNAKFGHLVAIYPTEGWAAMDALKFNSHIDADTHCREKVVYRCVDLGGAMSNLEKVKSEFRCDPDGKAYVTKRGLARLCGVPMQNWGKSNAIFTQEIDINLTPSDWMGDRKKGGGITQIPCFD